MYFIVNLDTFVILRGPFIDLQTAINVWNVCRTKDTKCIVVQMINFWPPEAV